MRARSSDQREQRIAHLLYLREFAEMNGALPLLFGWLVLDAFGDLLAVAQKEAAV